MIKIEGRKITITRGDCRPFTITLTGADAPADGTEVLFTVKKTSGHEEAVLTKTVLVAGGKAEIYLRNADTKELPFGEYEWDIRFPNLYGESEPFTPMDPAPFKIAKVIGDV